MQDTIALACDIVGSHELVVNKSKAEGPSQSITLMEPEFILPDDKVKEVLQLSGNMPSRQFTQRRHLQFLVGKFSFVAAALSGARPFFRQLIDASKSYKSPYSRIPVTTAAARQSFRLGRLPKKWNGLA